MRPMLILCVYERLHLRLENDERLNQGKLRRKIDEANRIPQIIEVSAPESSRLGGRKNIASVFDGIAPVPMCIVSPNFRRCS
jgi:hypothetical protein